MSQVPSVLNSKSTDQPFGAHNTLNDLDLDVFLKLMITQLQNQDPLNPMDNSELLQTISQIRDVGATDKLTSTLDSVLLGQNLASSTNLIGSDISAISDDNQQVNGIVDRVSIEDGKPKLHLDLNSGAVASTEAGDVKAGKYDYHVVWQDDDGNLQGVELAGDKGVTTTTTDHSIRISHLPVTSGPKQIYRTSNDEPTRYQLVATVLDGNQGSFLDKLSDEELSETTLTAPFQRVNASRSFVVSLNNVSEIHATQP